MSEIRDIAVKEEQYRQSSDTMEIDLVELLYRVLARWKLIAFSAIVCAVAAYLLTVNYITPMYRAKSTIYVVGNSDSVINMADLQLGSALTSDYIKVFDMWEVHEEVITNLNLPYSYKEIQKMLSVSNDKDTRMIDISITSPYPEEAARISNEYARVVSQFIADTMSTDKPNIMSVALVPSNPVSPNLMSNTIKGFLIGFALSSGFVVIRFLLDDKYKTADAITKYTGLTTLAVVPVEEGFAKKERKRGRK